MSAANTLDCILEFIGQELLGVIEDWSSSDTTRCKALVFKSGRALVLSDNGSYWAATVDEVQCVVERMIDQHERTQKSTERLLVLAGRAFTGRMPRRQPHKDQESR